MLELVCQQINDIYQAKSDYIKIKNHIKKRNSSLDVGKGGKKWNGLALKLFKNASLAAMKPA